MVASNMPAAEVVISTDLVVGLLHEQHPDLADQSIRVVAHGWDNAVVRVGDTLAVRLPRRQLASELVEHEQRWLSTLADRLPLPIPAPVRVGTPSAPLGYPWRWSVIPWFDGHSAIEAPPNDPTAAARTLGAFLAALHVDAPAVAAVDDARHGAGLLFRASHH